MAAAYLFHIIRNHPFVDGNKRTGVVAALVFLMMNGIELRASEDKLEAMVRSVAEGRTNKAKVASFLRKHAAEYRRLVAGFTPHGCDRFVIKSCGKGGSCGKGRNLWNRPNVSILKQKRETRRQIERL